MIIIFILVVLIINGIIISTSYQLGWIRSQIAILDELTKALKKGNISGFFEYMGTTRPPVWYEPFLTRKQIKKLDEQKKVETK